jgi:integrase
MDGTMNGHGDDPTPPDGDAVGARRATGKSRVRRHRNGNLYKKCSCPRSAWAKTCPHPWHFALAYKGRRHRVPLHKVAGKAATEPMSKSEAERWATRLRTQIWEGQWDRPAQPETRLTFDDLAALFEKARTERGKDYHLAPVRHAVIPTARGGTLRFGTLQLATITTADIEALRTLWLTRRPQGKQGRVGANRMLAALRGCLNWAIAKGYLDATPFKRHGVTVVKLDTRAENPRERRLEGDEEQRLLAHAEPLMRDVIVALLETGCRQGELRSLQFSQVRWTENVFLLPADKTKTRRARVVPITAKLREVLERRQIGPDGQTLGPGCYVFGTEVGERRCRFDEAWRRACAAAGIENLHLHDLRREFASRLLESGANSALVRDWLGHASLTMTSRYLATTAVGLQTARAQFERHTASAQHA